MTSLSSETVLMWVALSLYAGGSVLYVLGLAFRWQKLTMLATQAWLVGVVPHAVAIVVRWVRVGHAPFLGFYEVVSGFALAAVVALGLLLLRHPDLSPAGVVIAPLASSMMVAAMLAPRGAIAVPGEFASWWLVVHSVLGKVSFALFVGSFALAVVYLVRAKWGEGRLASVFAEMSGPDVVDDLSFKLAAAGFICLGAMIAAGAIWANEAWGAYWSWAPIETWSLVSWLVYAVYLHLRLTLHWRGRKAAWIAVIAMPVVAFTFVGVPVVYQMAHGAFLGG